MRRTLRSVGAMTVSSAVAITVAACGSGGSSADSDGVLKYGYPMAVAGLHLDPAKAYGDYDLGYFKLFYGSLLREASDGTFTPWMAENVEVVDPSTVRITLREGVTFSDGAPFDAEAVKTSLMHAKNPQTPAAKANLDSGLKAVDSIEVVNPLTAVVTLSKPVAGEFYAELARRPGSIISPKQLAENPDQIDTMPVGAGPFVVAEHQAGQVLSVRKNPDYWNAESVELQGVDVVNTPTGPQHANGLLAGALDWASYVSVDSAASIESDDAFDTKVSNRTNVYLNMCTSKPPFDNEKFRQAIQIGIDRSALSDRVYKGLADPAYSVNPSEGGESEGSLASAVTYDPERAKQLLAESGVANPTVELHFPATTNLGQEAEALQAQLEAIGVKVNITSDRDALAAFSVPQLPGALLQFYVGHTGYSQYASFFRGGSSQALCGVNRQDVMDVIDGAAGLSPDDPGAVAAYDQAGTLVADHAYLIPIVTYPNVQAWRSDLIDGEVTVDALGFVDFDKVKLAR